MKILLVHQNFPGQFRGLAPALLAAGHQVKAISMRRERQMVGIENLSYRPGRSSTAEIHPWLVNTESAVIRAEAAATRASQLSETGWQPDVVLGHTGWGEMMLMRQVFPQARLLGFNELFYRVQGGDVGFDPEFPADETAPFRLQVRNMHLLSSLLACDVGVTATQWQANCFPDSIRSKIQVIHDGIHTDQLQPDPKAFIRLVRERMIFRPGDEVVTFINRNLEPMRGYHQFMRALPRILAQRPKAHVVIVGGDQVSYGAKPPAGQTYKDIYWNEVRGRLDVSRVHFVGQVPYTLLIQLLQVSAAHVYLTAPFVLSWSMLEAMSLGAMVVGSATAPVQEVIQDGKNGRLVDFFDPADIANTVCDVLTQPNRHEKLRRAARKTIVDRYDFQKVSLPAYLRLITQS